MTYKLQHAPAALRDLDEISAYITEELSNPDAASQIVNRILDATERLERFPESGTLLSSISGVPSDYRFIPVQQYLIFYRIQTESVYIDRVLYGRRDYMRILFDPQGKT